MGDGASVRRGMRTPTFVKAKAGRLAALVAATTLSAGSFLAGQPPASAPGEVTVACACAAPSTCTAELSELTVSLIFRASSIAMFGTGGVPRLTARAAIRPARPPSASRIAAIAKNPQKYAKALKGRK